MSSPRHDHDHGSPSSRTTSQLVGLFAPPPPPLSSPVSPPATVRGDEEESRIRRNSLKNDEKDETTSLLRMVDSYDDDDDSSRRYSSTTTHRQRDSLGGNDAFAEFKALRDDETNLVQFEDEYDHDHSSCWRRGLDQIITHPVMQPMLQPTTWAGAFMFLLYHVVFVLAFGSALMRPHAASTAVCSAPWPSLPR